MPYVDETTRVKVRGVQKGGGLEWKGRLWGGGVGGRVSMSFLPSFICSEISLFLDEVILVFSS